MLRRKYNFTATIAAGEALARTAELVAQAARSHFPVLLVGPVGTGRDCLAHAIHEASARAGRPFVIFDCRKRTAAQLEDMLHGDPDNGAAASAGGVLLLQHVHELAPTAQIRLTEYLQDRRPEMGTQNTSDLRIIAATDSSLTAEMEAGRLRPELFYRLNVMAIQVPGSLARREDIASVLEFLWELGEIEARALPGSPAEEWLAQLKRAHPWSDEVRDFQQAIVRAAALETPARWDALMPAIARLLGQPRPTVLHREDIDLLRRTADHAIKQFDALGGDIYGTIVRQIERQIVEIVLRRCNGVKTRAAEILGLSLAVLNRKIRELGLETVSIATDAAQM